MTKILLDDLLLNGAVESIDISQGFPSFTVPFYLLRSNILKSGAENPQIKVNIYVISTSQSDRDLLIENVRGIMQNRQLILLSADTNIVGNQSSVWVVPTAFGYELFQGNTLCVRFELSFSMKGFLTSPVKYYVNVKSIANVYDWV